MTQNTNAQHLVSGQLVRVKKLIRDMSSYLDGLESTGPSLFQNPETVAKYKKRIDQFYDAVSRYTQYADPEVAEATNLYGALTKAFNAELAKANEQSSQLGDVQELLRTMEANARKYAPPSALAVPFSSSDILTWFQHVRQTRQIATQNKEKLQTIAKSVSLPDNPGTVQSGAPYDRHDIDRLYRMADTMLSKLKDNYTTMVQDMDSQMHEINSQLSTRWQDDPQGDKRWTYLKPEQIEQAHALFARGEAVANSYISFATGLKRPTTNGDTLRANVEISRKNFAKRQTIALETSRLPDAVSSNQDMIGYAKIILALPRYEFGKHGPIVLTVNKISEHERKDKEVNFTDAEFHLGGDVTLTGTEKIWTYIWQEFKFATPIQDEDGNWYIWWITARNYSSGSTVTPLHQWISGEATKGNQILKKNF